MPAIFYITLLLLIPLFGKSSNNLFYTVNLAIYKDKKILDKKLSNFSPAMRNTITITKDKGVYKVKTLVTTKKTLLTTLLPRYKKIFPDAFITTTSFDKQAVQAIIEKSKQHITKNENSFYKLLKGKTFYLTAERKAGDNKKFLIKVTFDDSTVTYSPIYGKMPPMTLLYKVRKNRLFLYQKDLFNPKVYSLLEANTFKYHLLSSWVNDKKVNMLRYYLNLHDAKAYLNLF